MAATRTVRKLEHLIHKTARSWLLLAAALLAGCSPLTVLSGFGPDSAYKKISTARYGPGPRQALDIYQPAVPRDGVVVVFFYGGSWSMGNRAEYRFVAQTLTRYGATVVVADYRLHPGVVFPAFMEDAAAAVAWTARNIGRYGGDPKKIYLLGHSAGAHIVTLLALDKRFMAAQGLGTDVIAGVDALSAPTDFAATLAPRYRPVFVDQSVLDLAQPIRYAHAGAPPMLLQHGADDTLVLPRNSQALADKINAAGGSARAIIYADKGHAGTVLAFTELFGRSAVLDDALHFLGLRQTP